MALFTRSAYTRRGLAVLHPDPETVERVTAMRRAEDESFCASVGLGRMELGLEEPSLRGRRSRDATGVADDVAQLEAPLVAELRRLFDEQPAPRRLFCPAGIGGHVNHLATRAVVVANLGWIAQQADVVFYEDLHYASRPGARLRGLRDLRRALAGRRLFREAFPVRDRAAKLAMINAYPSQHLVPVLSLRQGYTPAAIWPLRPHEAVWRVLQ